MRERMDLLAGFATTIPFSPRAVRFGAVIADFTNNSLLVQRLGKTEGVHKIDIKFIAKEVSGAVGIDEFVALPGGSLGAQAFYSILENIIRDRAKYGDRQRKIRIQIRLT